MATFKRFEDLQVWQDARNLRGEIRLLINNSTISKDFNLKDQITRASRSIMANISEGFERGTTQDFVRFLYISKGSCSEVRNHLYEAFDEGYISQDELNKYNIITESVSSQLSKFIAYLDQTDKRTRTRKQIITNE